MQGSCVGSLPCSWQQATAHACCDAADTSCLSSTRQASDKVSQKTRCLKPVPALLLLRLPGCQPGQLWSLACFFVRDSHPDCVMGFTCSCLVCLRLQDTWHNHLLQATLTAPAMYTTAECAGRKLHTDVVTTCTISGPFAGVSLHLHVKLQSVGVRDSDAGLTCAQEC